MKHSIFSVLIILLFALQVTAQMNDSIPLWRQNQISKIVDCIKNDNYSELSELIRYPIKRPNPIPALVSKESFMLYCSTLFDDNFKQKLINIKFMSNNTINRNDDFGFFYGYIWINKSGKIIALNYNSDKELLIQKTLKNEAKSLIQTSVKKSESTIILCHSDKILIRIDLLNNLTLRYASWSYPKTIHDKPDLVLLNGVEELHGTTGGVTYTFKNSRWKYVIDKVDISENDKEGGLFFKLLINDQEQRKTRLTEIK
jgi:hypothetical protein